MIQADNTLETSRASNKRLSIPDFMRLSIPDPRAKRGRSTILMNFEASTSMVKEEKGWTLDEAIIAAGGFGKF